MKTILYMFFLYILVTNVVNLQVEKQILLNTNFEYNEKDNYIIYKGNKYIQESQEKLGLVKLEWEDLPETEAWTYLGLTLFGGLMSGLTVGYLSIDELVLELKQKTGTEKEKKYSGIVIPILAKHHWLLVTLLVANAFAMEALPLFLDKLVPEFIAIILSVTLVLVFGEIIPQAICTGPNQVKIAAMISPVTIGLMWITSPISWPIGKLLDCVFGKHSKSRFQNTDLKALIELHTFNALNSHASADSSHHSSDADSDIGIDDQQANIMIAVIEGKDKKVSEIMIPMDKAFMVCYDECIDGDHMHEIINKGFSRIPVYGKSKNEIEGILLLKSIIGRDIHLIKSTIRQSNIPLRKPLIIGPNMNLLELLKEFRIGKSHMAIVTNQVADVQRYMGLSRNNSVITRSTNSVPYEREMQNMELLGIITLEDVIETLLKLEILDESDYEKNAKNLKEYEDSTNSRTLRKFTTEFIKKEVRKLSVMVKNVNKRTGTVTKQEKLDKISEIGESDFDDSQPKTFLQSSLLSVASMKEPLV